MNQCAAIRFALTCCNFAYRSRERLVVRFETAHAHISIQRVRNFSTPLTESLAFESGITVAQILSPVAFPLWIRFLDSDLGNPFMRTSDRVTEAQVQALKSMGASESEITSLIQKARANPA